MEIFQDGTFQTKFNQVNHEFEIYLDSGFGQTDTKRYPINPNSVVNLTIEDTLSNWVVRGTLSFFYNPESGSTKLTDATGQTKTATTNIERAKIKPFHTFRNDGYDFLRIRIKPKLSGNSTPNSPALKITDPVAWTLSYYFSIYDMEDIDLPPGAQNHASATMKCLKLYFWDSWYQKMLTNTLAYSTALSPYANPAGDIQEGIYDNPGVISTGQAMREIINLSLGQDSSQQSYRDTTFVDPKLGFNYEPISQDWEAGAANIFYTSPTNTTALESLTYVYDKHISEEKISLPPTVSAPRGGTQGSSLNDYSILLKERGPTETDVGVFSLKSVSSYFKKAGKSAEQPGDYQIEHFFLQSYADKNTPAKTLRGPVSKGYSDTKDFKSLNYSTITNYRFVDIAALTNSTAFVNTPVYSFDFKNRKFNIEFQGNSVEAARDFMNKKYISEVYKNDRSDLKKLFLINLNDEKQNKVVKPAFSLYGDNPLIRQSAGLQKLLYIGLFQNAAVNFRTLGLTLREPGRFIAIDRTEGVDTGDFEDKFYGQWFIVDVKHIFESEIYYNDITAIKIHRFQELAVPFSGTI
jgi:hypothetical protein